MGYPVYYSDDRAKILMQSDLTVQRELKLLLGDEAYTEDGLNRAFVSNKIFSDTTLRKKINQLIHPIVREDFEQWKKDFIREKFIFNEAAILFETGAHLNYDAVILVHAPIDIKLKRIKKRDGISEEDVLKKMKSQWSDDKKMQLTMHYILNDGESPIEERIALLLEQLSKPI
jgi:dephospho-CoA kinase